MPVITEYSSRSALPSEWDRRQWGRAEALQRYLKVDGLGVKYVGPGEGDHQAAAVLADQPVPPDIPLYFFEVTVVSRGDKGYIGVGFCSEGVNFGRLPGWEPHSYGYHGDDGHAFHGSGSGVAFGPTFTTGDVVGALLHRGSRTIGFYKNGEFVGTAFHDVQETQLYPCVGMRTPHEEIRANFGSSPFSIDLKAIQAQYRAQVLETISSVELPVAVSLQQQQPAMAAGKGEASEQQQQEGEGQPGQQQDASRALLAALTAAGGSSAAAAAGSGRRQQQPLLPFLVFDYLLHQRCWQTAALVARDMLAGSDSSGNGAAAAAAAAAAGGGVPQPMDCSPHEDTDMPDAAAAAAATPAQAAAPPAQAAAADAAGGSAAAAAAAAASAVGGLSEADIQDALARQQIFESVCQGRLSAALAQVQQVYGSSVLDSNPSLAFKLKVQAFVELVRAASSSSGAAAGESGGGGGASAAAAADAGGGSSSSSSAAALEEALSYGRAELGPGSRTREDEELLSDALSLLAYAVPAASPCGHLLRPAARTALAEELNGALLKARGTSAVPLLETMYRQAVVVVDELKRQGLPAALVLDVPGLLLAPDKVAAAAADEAGSSESKQSRAQGAVPMKQD